MAEILRTHGLTRCFGGLTAVNAVDFKVLEGEVTGLIGPNGAGKTTLFNNMTGLDVPTDGRVIFQGRDITALPAHRITRLGVARTFQNIRLFKDMTVLENVMVGRHFKVKGGVMHRLFGSLARRGPEQREIARAAMETLDFMGLASLANHPARSLPYGKQRELEIARALATEPRVLFLDEPAAGMNPQETDELVASIRRIGERGITVVLIEHDMKLVMTVCQRITVLNYGTKIAEGTPGEIRQNPQVIEAYLGKDDE